MNTLRILPRLLLPLLAFAGAVPEGLAKSSLEERREKVRKVRDATLAELYKLHPAAKGRLGKADGYAVFSNIGINLFFASFAGGSGLVVDRKGGETFMKMGSVGIGLGLGIKDFRAVFISMIRRSSTPSLPRAGISRVRQTLRRSRMTRVLRPGRRSR